MLKTEIEDYVKLVPAVKHSPTGQLWSSYDAEANVLYISFEHPSPSTDSELTDEDVIVRYRGEEMIDLTILHASKPV